MIVSCFSVDSSKSFHQLAKLKV
jgi:hypothetical protein